MKKWIIIAIVVLLVVILVVPIPSGAMKDGGTREYTALTYKVVKWNRITEDYKYQKTSVYFFPKNFADTETLWLEEMEKEEFTAEWLDDETPDAMVYKPVIYLYPEETQQVSVKIDYDGKLTCTYPEYGQGWNVIADPDGTLTDTRKQTFNYLYWEGIANVEWDMSRGFCVRGEDTAKFLEQALEQLGLNRREANEFIVYWLPQMEQNPYNVISFQTDVYTEVAQLEIDPVPDTLIRVFMAWQRADSPVELPSQELNAPPRQGFTVVEWGGSEIR